MRRVNLLSALSRVILKKIKERTENEYGKEKYPKIRLISIINSLKKFAPLSHKLRKYILFLQIDVNSIKDYNVIIAFIE